jgi:uncharacterized protein (DUF885 family)
MRKCSIAIAMPVLVALAGCATVPADSTASEAAQPGDAQAAFAALSEDYIDTLTRLDPVQATQLGDHRFDGRLPDITSSGRAKERAEWVRLQRRLAQIDRAALSRDSQVDYLLLDNQLRYAVWQLDTLREWSWNPQLYNDLAANSLYSLVARDFAPWPQRLKSAIERMEKLPAFLAETRRQLDPKRVPRVHAEIVAQQNAGILEIVDAALLPELGELERGERTRFDEALAGLKEAVAEHQKWLDERLVPNAAGEFRLGTELYDTKMRFEMMSPMDRLGLKARAEEAKRATRREMFALAQQVLAKQGQTVSTAGSADEIEQRTIEAALALSYAKRPAREELEQRARETLAEATRFTAEKGLVSMPQGEVRVITMPKFWQGNAVAYDDPPPALERHLPNFYAVSPIPEAWSDEQATSFLTEYNDYMIHDLSIHEGVPGHYLQLDHANRHPGRLRAVLQSGPFIEGWAVYAEGVMADEGYLGGDPLFKLTVLKMRLRSITNTLLDIGIHTEGMTRDQAMELMMKGAFQQEREAAGKWIRANLSSVQLLSYFTGYVEHMDLRASVQRRRDRPLDLKRHHDEVLSHGSPPARFVRQLMLGEPVE